MSKGGRTIMKNAHCGCTETSFRTPSKYCTPIPKIIHNICLYLLTAGWPDGQLAKNQNKTRNNSPFTYYLSSTQASEVFPGFHLNVSLIFGVQLENQDYHVWDTVCEKNYTCKIKTIKSSVKVYFSLRTSIPIISIPITLCCF